MKLVLVEWIDSHSGRGWRELDDISETAVPLYCRSVGWVVADSEDCIVLVPHIAGEKNTEITLQGCGDLVIPSQAILGMKVIVEEDVEGKA